MTASAGDNFLGLHGPQTDPAAARYVVLPVPYEGTVSYEAGTADGPGAILRASRHVELFDEELRGEFFGAGIHTAPAVESARDPAEQMRRVRAAAEPWIEEGKFLLTLGGEHSITVPIVEAVAAAAGEISVLQVDAHADLRDRLDGTPQSHGCVMRRILATTPRICQVGVRSFSREEFAECRPQADHFITPEEIDNREDWIDKALDLLGKKVYVTVDMDGLDPSIAPGVGTPEPGGLTWRQLTRLLRRVCGERHVVAADIVEVRPIPPNHVTEFIAARLAYKFVVYTQQ